MAAAHTDHGHFILKYRAEIDGLRAFAVVPVVLFHAGIEGFSGGFVGVDVFFVISGYLITSIILSEIKEDRFSLIGFYERRARRIIPALFFVSFVCIGLAWLWLMPREMKDFSQSLVAVAAFASNLLFWVESGYFDTTAELKPLLHTWSLAVEEQYYILFPLLMLLIWRFRRNALVWVLGIIFAASLGLAQWAAYARPSAAFFLLPTRGWEILLGAFCALYLADHPVRATSKNQMLSGLGLAMILVSVFLFDETTPTPSLYTAVPTLGAVLIILFGTGDGVATRILTNKIVVGLGLISYSLYLWHQPIIVFAKQRFFFIDNELTVGACIVVFALTLALAYCTWRWIEAPFRSRDRVTAKSIFALSIGGIIVLAAVGVAGHKSGGFPARFPGLENVVTPEVGDLRECQTVGITSCRVGLSSAPASIAVIGDSHSVVLRKSLAKTLRQREAAAELVNNHWCAPLLDVGTTLRERDRDCRRRTDAALRQIANNPEITHVVLVAEWANYTTGERWAATGTAYYSDAQSSSRSVEENIAVFNRGLDRTLSLLGEAGKRVILVGSVPEYALNVPAVLGKTALYEGRNQWERHTLSQEVYRARNKEVEAAFQRIRKTHDIEFVNTYDLFCANERCKPFDGSHSLYTDGNHLSYEGSRRLVSAILSAIEASAAVQ